MDMDVKQLMALAMVVSVSGAGGSLLTRSASTPHPPPGILRDEFSRLEVRWERRLDECLRRVRSLEMETVQ